MLHDTHAHLEMLLQKLDVLVLPDREDFDPTYKYEFPTDYLEKSLKDHEFIIQATTSTKNFLLTHHLFKYNSKIKFLIGSHPEIVDEDFSVEAYLLEQKTLLQDYQIVRPNAAGELELVATGLGGEKQIVGVGECGLDYNYTQDKETIRKQWGLFEAQCSLAAYLSQPLIIHTRNSFADTFAILQKFPTLQGQFIFHCFSGTVNELEQVLGFGGSISVGGIVTFKNAETLRQVVQACPLERLLIETDLPFLAPTPHRGKVCLPQYIDLVAEKIAELKGLAKAELWTALRQNTNRFFAI